ncbi:MAG: hypothetical protein K8R06_02440 [Methanosarcinales archaeon]|nr:hypothetical protein [Methanosarcinales archaeon]MCD4815242.1 hypothetical protein [Methanosarcinales archaeon]
MKKIIFFMTMIILCSVITLGCIGEEQEQVRTVGGTASELTPPAIEKPQSLMVYCGAGMRTPMDGRNMVFQSFTTMPVRVTC